MLHRTAWDAPSASSKKEVVSFNPETELGYVASNCIGRAVASSKKKLVLD